MARIFPETNPEKQAAIMATITRRFDELREAGDAAIDFASMDFSDEQREWILKYIARIIRDMEYLTSD